MSSPKTTSMVTRIDTIVTTRRHKCFLVYRHVAVQVLVKTLISTPFVVWWLLWIFEWLRVPDANSTDIVLPSTFMSYLWLFISAFFNWQLTLDMWSYFSIVWSIPIGLSAVELILLKEYFFSIIMLALAVGSLMDGFLSITFKLPRVGWFTDEELECQEKQKVPIVLPRPRRIGIPFMLIPLDGRPHIPLTEFPNMSTPSTSKQAYMENSDRI